MPGGYRLQILHLHNEIDDLLLCPRRIYGNNTDVWWHCKKCNYNNHIVVPIFVTYAMIHIHNDDIMDELGLGLYRAILFVVWLYFIDITSGMIDTLNTLRQNGRQILGDIFKCIFVNENASISITISLKFTPKGPINNIPALVQIMAWRRPGDKPLSEPVMFCVLTHICVTRPQWVNNI